jgi:hypothetical protein
MISENIGQASRRLPRAAASAPLATISMVSVDSSARR